MTHMPRAVRPTALGPLAHLPGGLVRERDGQDLTTAGPGRSRRSGTRRDASARVLPEPAPASTSSGPVPCATASRCGGVQVLEQLPGDGRHAGSRHAECAPGAGAGSAGCLPVSRTPRRGHPRGRYPLSRRRSGPSRPQRPDLCGRLRAVPRARPRSARARRCGSRGRGSRRPRGRGGGPSRRRAPRARPSTRTGWPGLPTTVEFGGTSWMTTELAPIFAPWPIVIGPRSLAPEPIVTLSCTVGWRLPVAKPRAAERDALVEGHVVADLGRLADHHARAVVDEQALADLGRRGGSRCR